MLEFYIFFINQAYGYLFLSIFTAVVLIILLDTLYVSQKKGFIYKYRLLALGFILSAPTFIASILVAKFLIEVFLKDFIYELIKSFKNIIKGGE